MLLVYRLMQTYKPISCSFYSRLENLADLKKHVPLVYHTEEGQLSLPRVVIEDVYMEEKVEYLRLSDGTEIRLDRLVSVNGIPLRRHC